MWTNKWKLKRLKFWNTGECEKDIAILFSLSIWLCKNTYLADVRQLNSIYYRVLRIAVQGYRRVLTSCKLDMMGSGRPTVWSKYQTASIAIKTITPGMPERLDQNMLRNSYVERRRRGRLKFYDGSIFKIGRQMINKKWLTSNSAF